MRLVSTCTSLRSGPESKSTINRGGGRTRRRGWDLTRTDLPNHNPLSLVLKRLIYDNWNVMELTNCTYNSRPRLLPRGASVAGGFKVTSAKQRVSISTLTCVSSRREPPLLATSFTFSRCPSPQRRGWRSLSFPIRLV